MKDTYYFPHDYHARNDIKLQLLTMEEIGVYWCLVEMLYEENGYIKIELYERIANVLRIKYETIKSVVEDFELFEKDTTKFWSNSVLRRLKEREEKSFKAKESVKKRWDKYERNTNLYERNTIKESKGKESKEKNIDTSRFTPPTLEELTSYCKERNNSVDPQRFINFYESKGWMVGKNKMKDWKASVRTWELDKKDTKPKDVSERRIL